MREPWDPPEMSGVATAEPWDQPIQNAEPWDQPAPPAPVRQLEPWDQSAAAEPWDAASAPVGPEVLKGVAPAPIDVVPRPAATGAANVNAPPVVSAPVAAVAPDLAAARQQPEWRASPDARLLAMDPKVVRMRELYGLPAEGPLMTTTREFSRNVAPGTAAVVLGSEVGAAVSAVGTPVLGIPAGLLTGLAAYAMGRKVQDFALEKLMGEQWAEEMNRQLEVNRAQHPLAAQGGELAAQAVTVGPMPFGRVKAALDVVTKLGTAEGRALLQTRAGAAAVQDAINMAVGSGTQVGMEAWGQIQAGQVDAPKLVLSAILGGYLSKTTAIGRAAGIDNPRLGNAVQRAIEAGRPQFRGAATTPHSDLTPRGPAPEGTAPREAATVDSLQARIRTGGLEPEVRGLMADLQTAEAAAQDGAAGRVPVRDDRGNLIGWRNQGAVYPEGTSRETRGILEKLLAGKPLTDKQLDAAERAVDLVSTRISREAGYDVERQRPVDAGALKVGDEFKDGGETFRAVSADEDGGVTLKDGVTKRVMPGEMVPTDAGTLKDADGKLIDPAAREAEAAGAEGKVNREAVNREPWDEPAGTGVKSEPGSREPWDTPDSQPEKASDARPGIDLGDGARAERGTDGTWTVRDADGTPTRLDPANEAHRPLIHNLDPDARAADVAWRVNEEAAKLPGIGVDTVRSEAELEPRQIDSLRRKQADDGRTEAFYDPTTGRVTVILDNVRPDTDIARLIAEESAVHGGLHTVLGDNVDGTMDSIYAGMGPNAKIVKERIGRKRGLLDEYGGWKSDKARQEGMEEWLADVYSRRKAEPKVWQRVVAWVRETLRKAGVKLDMNDAEVETLMGKALQAAKTRKAGASATPVKPGAEIRMSLKTRESLQDVERRLPRIPSGNKILRLSGPLEQQRSQALQAFHALSGSVRDGNGRLIRTKHNRQGTVETLAEHLMTGQRGDTALFDNVKARWIPLIEDTLASAKIRILQDNGRDIYVGRYDNGYHHMVVVDPNGYVEGHGRVGDVWTHFSQALGSKGKYAGMTIERIGEGSQRDLPGAVGQRRIEGTSPDKSTSTDPRLGTSPSSENKIAGNDGSVNTDVRLSKAAADDADVPTVRKTNLELWKAIKASEGKTMHATAERLVGRPDMQGVGLEKRDSSYYRAQTLAERRSQHENMSDDALRASFAEGIGTDAELGADNWGVMDGAALLNRMQDRYRGARTAANGIEEQAKQAGQAAKQLDRQAEAARTRQRWDEARQLRAQAEAKRTEQKGLIDRLPAMRQQEGAHEREMTDFLDKMMKAGERAGQMVRQFAEIRGARPENMVATVERGFAQKGRVMTDAQRETMTGLAQKDIDARAALREAEATLGKAMAAGDEQAIGAAVRDFDRLQAAARKASNLLARNVSMLTPKSWPDLIRGLRSGNLLRFTSQVINNTSNAIMAVVEDAAQVPAAAVDYILARVQGRDRKIGLVSPVGRARGALAGAKQGLRGMVEGTANGDALHGEIDQRSLHPWQAFLQAIGTGREPKMLVGAETGTVPIGDRVKKMVEAVDGAYPEVNFRLLQLGDLVSRESRYQAVLQEMATLKKLKGAAREAFLRMPDRASRETAMAESLTSVYQGQKGVATGTVRYLQQSLRKTKIGDWFDAMVVHANAPYVTTPINVFATAAKLSEPMVAAASGLYKLRQAAKYLRLATEAETAGNAFKAEQYRSLHLQNYRAGMRDAVGFTLIGGAMNMVARMLIDKGLVQGDVDGDAKERGLAYAVEHPNEINFTGLARLLKGGDPTALQGDTWRGLAWLGFFGVNASIQYAQMKRREKSEKPDEQSWAARKALDALTGTVMDLPHVALDMTVLKGASVVMDAIASSDDVDHPGKVDRAITMLFRSWVGGVLPGVLEQYTRTQQAAIPVMKGETIGELAKNAAAQYNPWIDWDTAYPHKLDPMGKPVARTPEGVPAFFYHLADATKGHPAAAVDPIWSEIGKVYAASGDAGAIPSYPDRNIAATRPDGKDVKIKLTQTEHEELQKSIGAARVALYETVRRSGNTAAYEKLNPYQKANQLALIWSKGMTLGRSQWEEKQKRERTDFARRLQAELTGPLADEVMRSPARPIPSRAADARSPTPSARSLAREVMEGR